jgi:hypothetical protein
MMPWCECPECRKKRGEEALTDQERASIELFIKYGQKHVLGKKAKPQRISRFKNFRRFFARLVYPEGF